MEPIEAIETELNETTERARRLVESTEPRFFTVRPHPSAWSAAECMAHLSLASESLLPTLRAAIEDGRKRGLTSSDHPAMELSTRLLKWFLEPPVRTKVKTAARFVPRAVRSRADAMAEFTSFQTQLLEILHSARGLALSKLKIVSPFNARLRYNVYSAFRIIAAHQRRHLWQAEQAVEELRRRRAA
jgi:DinB family protein